MKRKKLLGPDGKPLDVAKYQPAKEMRYLRGGLLGRLLVAGDSFTVTLGDHPKVAPKPELREAVAKDVAALTADLDGWQGQEEAPPPPPEMTDTYVVAFDSAKRKCAHPNSHSTLYARNERQCEDCGTYFTRKPSWFE